MMTPQDYWYWVLLNQSAHIQLWTMYAQVLSGLVS